MWVAGVDGCRAGWIVVLMQAEVPGVRHYEVRLCPEFDDILTLHPHPAVTAVDIPIGLLDTPQPGGRLCDRAARRLLGRRASSVFSPPSRLCLGATHYDQVRQHGVSRQAFGILPKIRAVDQLLTPALQASVREAHPELAWYALQGQPMCYNKKTRAGQAERLRVLAPVLGVPLHGPEAPLSQALATFRRRDVAIDDLLDAFALAWTAYQIATAQARCLPVQPPCDRHGLRMEICYGAVADPKRSAS